MRGVEVLEHDAGAGKVGEEAGDAGPRTLCVVGIDQLAAAIGERQMMAVELGRNDGERVMQLEGELLLAELVHQLVLVLDEDQLALVDHADAIGHVLGLVDVMRGEDDGHAGIAQVPDRLPHLLPQRDVDSGGRLVEEEDGRLV